MVIKSGPFALMGGGREGACAPCAPPVVTALSKIGQNLSVFFNVHKY